MRLLITGGAGFIGSAVIRHCLRNTDHSVINLDKLSYAACPESLSEVVPHDRYAFEQIDVCDSVGVQGVFERHDPDAVMHLAAESHVDNSINWPKRFIETNITGTFVMLEAAWKHFDRMSEPRKSKFRFHHVSTDEVFGSQTADTFATEKAAYAPSSPYSASKASSDMLVRAWHRTYGLPIVVSNCSNNYGPFQFPEKLVPLTILAAAEGRSIPLYGSGGNVRDWLFVDDHVEALLAIIERGSIGESYNIGGGVQTRNIDLVRELCRVLDERLPLEGHAQHEDLITFVADRPGHDLRYAVDISKIERELGWRPRVKLAEGIRRTVDWYLENGWWTNTVRARGHNSNNWVRFTTGASK